MPSVSSTPQLYATGPEDAGAYAAGYAEFIRCSTLRRQAAVSIADLLSNSLPADGETLQILDVGCNDGAMTALYLAELMHRRPATTLHVTLADPAADALGRAAARLSGLGPCVTSEGLNTTAECLVRAPGRAFDAVMALWVFYHLQPEVLAGLLRLVGPQGVLVVAMGSPAHPLRSEGSLAGLSRHGDSAAVEAFLDTARDRQLLDFERHTVPTQMDLHGLWEPGRGVTRAGEAFFSFVFNRDLDTLPAASRQELEALLDRVFRDQGGTVQHDHFLYLVRPGPRLAFE